MEKHRWENFRENMLQEVSWSWLNSPGQIVRRKWEECGAVNVLEKTWLSSNEVERRDISDLISSSLMLCLQSLDLQITS